MAGILSKDICVYLGTATYNTSTDVWTFSDYNEIFNIQAIPSLGGTEEQVDVTCLKDANRKYIKGIKDFGDSVEFTCLFDNSDSGANFRRVRALEEAGAPVAVKVEMPDKPASGTHGTTFEFAAQVSASLNEAEVNQALTFAMRCAIQSDMVVTNPA